MSAPRIAHGGGIAAAAARFGGRPEDWLDLSTGINPNPAALPEIAAAAWHTLAKAQKLDDPMLDKLVTELTPQERTAFEAKVKAWQQAAMH